MPELYKPSEDVGDMVTVITYELGDIVKKLIPVSQIPQKEKDYTPVIPVGRLDMLSNAEIEAIKENHDSIGVL